MITVEEVKGALQKVEDPELGRSIVDMGMVRDIRIEDAKVSFTLALTTLACPLKDKIVARAKEAVLALDGVEDVSVHLTEMSPEERQRLLGTWQERTGVAQRFNQVERAIAVMSGKGGVGKSLVSALLATHLRREGYKVGLLDADITGSSIPRILGLKDHPLLSPLGLVPVESSLGIKVMSINLLLPSEDEAVIWRGPLISGAIKQFWGDVVWGRLDFLVVDLPPGTADASLTVIQSLPLSGVLLVTSPQELVQMIVKKAMRMAQKMAVPILGIVENMSYAICPDTGRKWELFGPSKAEKVAQEVGIPLLGRIPIDPQIARLCDEGRIEEYESETFTAIVRRLKEGVPRAVVRFPLPDQGGGR